MKTKLLTLLIFVTMLSSCGHGASSVAVADEASLDTLYHPLYARGFNILRNAAGKSVIEVYNPWQGAEGVTERVTLDKPAQRVVVMSSTAVAMLDAVGRPDAIVGVSGRQYISTQSVTSRGDAVAEVGYEGNIDYEALLAAKPDIVIVYGVNGPSLMKGKLAEAGIPVFYLGDYLEESPLGKAEWMVALGEIVGAGARARMTFNAIPPRYEAVKARVASIDSVTAPTVMLNAPYGDAWYMPGDESYMIQLVRDAGGRYIFNDNPGTTSSTTVDMEQAYALVSQADCWINVGSFTTMNELKSTLPKLAGTPVVSRGGVFVNNLRMTPGGGNDFFEGAIVRPELVLRDLVKIFHPEAVPEEFTYYRQLK